MALEKQAKLFLHELEEKWHQLHESSNIFAYSLDILDRKYLPGNHSFYAELNPKRTNLRRPPQVIPSLNPTFNSNNFNFLKINPLEILIKIPFESIQISMIINKSPLSRFHTLICPDVEACQPQRITSLSIKFCIQFLRGLGDDKKNYRIGYNSPGALASVNHFHLHLIHVETKLYIDRVKLEPLPLPASNVYRLSNNMPTEAICWVIPRGDNEKEIEYKTNEIHKFCMWLCEQNIPHNLFITPALNDTEDLKVFIYARNEFCVVKDVKAINLGFCELSGYFTLGDKILFDELTEQKVITKIKAEAGNVYKCIYNYFV